MYKWQIKDNRKRNGKRINNNPPAGADDVSKIATLDIYKSKLFNSYFPIMRKPQRKSATSVNSKLFSLFYSLYFFLH